MENLGHLEGMLDRDQRTAKLRFFSDKQVARTYSSPEKTVNESNSNSIISRHRSFCPTRTKNSNSSYLMWKNGYLLKSLHRLTNVLIVGVYLTLVTLPSTSSAPTNVNMSNRKNIPQDWINPCKINISQSNETEESDPNISGNGLPVSVVVHQAEIALHHAKSFRDTYAEETFGMPSFEAVQGFFQIEPTWLNIKLPKSFGEEIPTEKAEEVILDVYGFLQMVAVGLEQVVWDQKANQGQFEKHFTDAKDHLKNVLCELQMAIIARNITMREDVTRDIMKEEDRHLNITQTKARDFRIFREYMNILDYITKAFS